MQGETKFKIKVQADLNTLPHIWHLKTSERSIRGIPDILMCLNSFFVAIELKDTGGKTDKLQDYNLAKISGAGGISMVSYPETWGNDFVFLKKLAELPISSYRLTLVKNRELRNAK